MNCSLSRDGKDGNEKLEPSETTLFLDLEKTFDDLTGTVFGLLAVFLRWLSVAKLLTLVREGSDTSLSLLGLNPRNILVEVSGVVLDFVMQILEGPLIILVAGASLGQWSV